MNRYVSQRLRELRIAKGLSQTAAGQLIARHVAGAWRVQAVSRAELCEGREIKRWNVDDIYGLAAAFEVPVSYFLQNLDAVPPRSRTQAPTRERRTGR